MVVVLSNVTGPLTVSPVSIVPVKLPSEAIVPVNVWATWTPPVMTAS